MQHDNNSDHISLKILKNMEARLIQRHRELSIELGELSKEIRQEVPKNFKDALNLKEDIAAIEEEDNVEENELILVEEALQRIANKTFGRCADCDAMIPIERLNVIPYAKFCIPCQQKHEKKK